MLFSVSVREVAEMKPIDDDSIKAIVLTGNNLRNMWRIIFAFLPASSSRFYSRRKSLGGLFVFVIDGKVVRQTCYVFS